MSNPDQKTSKLVKQEGIDGGVKDLRLEGAMNPVDHPHGGGEGKRLEVEAALVGSICKRFKTRRPKKDKQL